MNTVKKPHPGDPDWVKYGTIDHWCRSRGMGRTTTYDLLKRGQLRAVKCGKRTLIDFEHGDAYMASLPSAYPIAA